jgi:hypothetical protein
VSPRQNKSSISKSIIQAIIPRLEEAEYVYKYSWFITRWNKRSTLNASDFRMEDEEDWYLDPVNALMLVDSAELSPIGMLYNEL